MTGFGSLRNKPRKKNPRAPMISRAHTIGDRVIGHRGDKGFRGELVETYVTINDNDSGLYRNPAYVVKCDCDGKNRSFQGIWKESKLTKRQLTYVTVK